MRLWAMTLVVTVAACGRPAASPRPLPSLVAGRIVPIEASAYPELLRSLRGRPLVVNFWASWCGPCKEELPRFVDAARRYAGRVAFLGVNVQDSRPEAQAFARARGMNYPSVADPEGRIMEAEKVLGLPVTFFYDSSGRRVFEHNGEISSAELERKLGELLRLSGAHGA